MKEDSTNSNTGEEYIGHLGIIDGLAKIGNGIKCTFLNLAANRDLVIWTAERAVLTTACSDSRALYTSGKTSIEHGLSMTYFVSQEGRDTYVHGIHPSQSCSAEWEDSLVASACFEVDL